MRSEVKPSGVVVVFPEGSLDATVAPALRAELQALVGDGTKRVVVDLSGVDSIDSTALGALVSGLKAARKNGGDLRIAGLSPRLESLVQLANLTKVLRVVDPSDGIL